MSFEPIKKLNAADQVATSIRDAILGGRFTPGDALPSERTLAGQFAVNRSTVREALKRLDTWGLVQTRHGGSTRVRNFLVTAGLSLLPHLIAPGGRVDPKLVADLLQIRAVLLEFSARLAVRKARPADLAELEELIGKMEVATESEQLQALDWRFFQQIVAIGDNRVLVLLVGPMGEVYAENQALFQDLYAPTFSTEHHRGWLRAAKAGDEEAAALAMKTYGTTVLGGRL